MNSSGIISDPSGFPERLKSIRAFRGYKQIEIARMLGISPTVYSSWETGLHLPRGLNYVKLAQILNVPIDVLLEGPKKGENLEDYLQLSLSKKFLALLTAQNLCVDSDLGQTLKIASKYNFSVLDGLESAYKDQRMFLYSVDDDSMASLSGKSINKGMTAVIVNAPNPQAYNGKPILIAVDGQPTTIRVATFEQAKLRLTPWNKNYEEQVLDFKQIRANIFGYVAMVFDKFF